MAPVSLPRIQMGSWRKEVNGATGQMQEENTKGRSLGQIFGWRTLSLLGCLIIRSSPRNYLCACKSKLITVFRFSISIENRDTLKSHV